MPAVDGAISQPFFDWRNGVCYLFKRSFIKPAGLIALTTCLALLNPGPAFAQYRDDNPLSSPVPEKKISADLDEPEETRGGIPVDREDPLTDGTGVIPDDSAIGAGFGVIPVD